MKSSKVKSDYRKVEDDTQIPAFLRKTYEILDVNFLSPTIKIS